MLPHICLQRRLFTPKVAQKLYWCPYISRLQLNNMESILDHLQQFSACDISDALSVYGHSNGGSVPNFCIQLPVVQSQLVAGPAYTVLYAPLDDPRPAVLGHYMDQVPRNSVVVVATTPSLQISNAPFTTLACALYGGLMSTRAQFLGARGSVIAGRIRDIDEHCALQYPVWSYGVGTCAPGGSVKVVDVNCAVTLDTLEGPVVIDSEDLIVADKNGVVRIPKDANLQKLIDYIKLRVKADTLVAQDLKGGACVHSAQRLHRGKIVVP